MRRSGQRCEGRKPYGSPPEEQAVIERIRSLRKARKSFAEIADALNTGNIPTRTGQGTKWHPTQTQRILGR
jgi:Recombinase